MARKGKTVSITLSTSPPDGAYTHLPELIAGVRISDLKDIGAILDVFQKHGHTDVCIPPRPNLLYCGSVKHTLLHFIG